MSAALAYNGLALDRVLGRRDAPEWIEAVLARPASRVIPFWRDGCLVRDLARPRPMVLGARAAGAVLEHAALCAFLNEKQDCGTEQFVELLLEEALTWSRNGQEDDITIVAIDLKGPTHHS